MEAITKSFGCRSYNRDEWAAVRDASWTPTFTIYKKGKKVDRYNLLWAIERLR